MMTNKVGGNRLHVRSIQIGVLQDIYIYRVKHSVVDPDPTFQIISDPDPVSDPAKFVQGKSFNQDF
jgi:hypothetical protein